MVLVVDVTEELAVCCSCRCLLDSSFLTRFSSSLALAPFAAVDIDASGQVVDVCGSAYHVLQVFCAS